MIVTYSGVIRYIVIISDIISVAVFSQISTFLLIVYSHSPLH